MVQSRVLWPYCRPRYGLRHTMDLLPLSERLTGLALYTAGPVDGPAIFTNCSGGQVAVACQQFQAKNCTDVEFGALPSAVLPSL